MKWLLAAPSQQDIDRLLGAWRLWVLAGIIGAVVGGVVYPLFPPPYRTKATVVLDFNLEEAWPENSDRDMFYYLERETRKLIELAWSDATLEVVADEVDDVTIEELRNGKLLLSQPREAGWHLWADDPDPVRAQKIASAWARAFESQVQQAVTVEIQLKALHASLTQGGACEPPETSEARIKELQQRAYGINPYIEITASQTTSLPVTRRTGAGTYVLIGTLGGLLLAVFSVLFIHAKSRDDEKQ